MNPRPVEKLVPSALVTMCAWCRRIRRQEGWVESGAEHAGTAVPLTHGICHDCLRRRFPSLCAGTSLAAGGHSQ